MKTIQIIYVVSNLGEDMLMPMVGSNDNYVVDEVTLQFFYSCLELSSPINIISSDELYCDHINVVGELLNSMKMFWDIIYIEMFELVTVFDSNVFNFSYRYN